MARLQTLPRRRQVAFLLLGVLTAAALTGQLFADFATPFVEINNQVGDRSKAHGYVVSLGGEEATHFIVIVVTDTMEFVVIRAMAEAGVVKPSVLGRPAIIEAEVTEHHVDKEQRVSVELKLLSVASAKKAEGLRSRADPLATVLQVPGVTAAAEEIAFGIRLVFATEDRKEVEALRIRVGEAAERLTTGGQVKSVIEVIESGAVLRLTSDVPYVVSRLRDQAEQMVGRRESAARRGVGDAPPSRSNTPPVTVHEDLRGTILKREGKDLRTLDLRNVDLTRTTFDSFTQWPSPDRLPAGFKPDELMEWGKYPGLGVRALHDRGITGRGVHVAIIDQPLLRTHVEYRDQLSTYTEIGTDNAGPQMHGAAVASILVGRSCGVAPEAILHYWAEPSWKRDYQYRCEALEQILEHNKGRPLHLQIRVVSVSKGFSSDEPHLDRWKELLATAQESGIYVIHCSRDIFGVGVPPFKDSDVPGNYQLCAFYQRLSRQPSFDTPGLLFAPVDSRTIASCQGDEAYIFWSEGGLSWGAPYIAGVAALGLQVNPGLAESQIERLLYESGLPFQKGRLINPVRFAQEAHGLRR